MLDWSQNKRLLFIVKFSFNRKHSNLDFEIKFVQIQYELTEIHQLQDWQVDFNFQNFADFWGALKSQKNTESAFLKNFWMSSPEEYQQCKQYLYFLAQFFMGYLMVVFNFFNSMYFIFQHFSFLVKPLKENNSIL